MARDHAEAGAATRLLDVKIECWQLTQPIVIAGYTLLSPRLIVVTISEGAFQGRGEALGVYYHGDTAESLILQIEGVRTQVEAGVGREQLRSLLPAGGARNALDCALWDLESKLTGRPVYALAGLREPGPLRTTYTLTGDDPAAMAARARDAYREAKAIKIKLLGDEWDGSRVRSVRAARPDVWLGVDANQSYSRDRLSEMIPIFVDASVQLIEQPCKIGDEEQLDGLACPIALAADESVQTLADVELLVGRFQVVNIKLDKCGGLTEALHMIDRARQKGLGVMVGNMGGTSLSLAPAIILGQLCDVVDLDGPLFLSADRPDAVRYEDGYVTAPTTLWGWPT